MRGLNEYLMLVLARSVEKATRRQIYIVMFPGNIGRESGAELKRRPAW